MSPDSPVRRIALVAGPVVAVALCLLVDLDPAHPAVTRTAAVALLMAIWWMTECIPLAATALLPVVLFPLLGIMDGREVSTEYFNSVIFLFVGGFLVALAMQRWNLHRRIALRILMLTGVKPRRMLLGFMLVTAFLSMWISNTATTMMIVPIALAIVLKLEDLLGGDASRGFAGGIFLGIAYSASIGGIATLVGTPPNLAFDRIFALTFPAAPEISFARWMMFALPVAMVFLALAWFYLTLIFRLGRKVELDDRMFHDEYAALGPLGREEKVVLGAFVALVFLWLFRSDIQTGLVTIPGWSGLFSHPDFIDDGTVSIGVAVLLFLLPARKGKGRILNWETAAELPWGIVLLFGGGFALAAGFKESGLSLWLGNQLHGVANLPPVLVVGTVCLMIIFLTELTSNTATAQILLPILAVLAVSFRIHPLLLMVPGTLACSFAFMLPVATPPNAIVFGTNRVTISQMARTGFVLNLVGVVLLTLAIYLLGQAVLGIEPGVLPSWAVLK